MQTRARRVAVISAVSLLYLTGPTEKVSARGVELSNDVSISASNGPEESLCVALTLRCERPVIGAPRLVDDASNVGERLKIVVDAKFQPPAGRLQLTRLDLVARSTAPHCLERVPPSGCVYHLTYKEITDPDGLSIDPGRFPLKLHLSDFAGSPPPGDVIFTVEARGRVFPAAALTITLSGAGHEVIVNRVGDSENTQPGDAFDIPTRSTELVRALGRLETALRPKQIVELDESRSHDAELAAGFTHAFDFPSDAIIHEATLTLHVTTSDLANGFILLDRAVRNVGRIANRQLPIPLIFLKDVDEVQDPQNPSQGDTHDLSINLKHVLNSVLTPDGLSPPRYSNLAGDLTDGRLDVIVVGRSTVDYSDLTITLKDPPRVP